MKISFFLKNHEHLVGAAFSKSEGKVWWILRDMSTSTRHLLRRSLETFMLFMKLNIKESQLFDASNSVSVHIIDDGQLNNDEFNKF